MRGDPGQPADPRHGLVWSEIVDHIEDVGGYDGEYVTVTDLPRDTLAHHPWSLSGGGAGDLKSTVDAQGQGALAGIVQEIGRTTVVGDDDAWLVPQHMVDRRILAGRTIAFVEGERVRDFSILSGLAAVWPYEDAQVPRWLSPDDPAVAIWLWPNRSLLRRRTVFGKSFQQRGRPWYDHLETYSTKLRTPLSIAFAFVATHNHFVLDRGGKVFNRSAPVIKLPAEATLAEHWGLLGVLNTSTACFWLKQVSHNKGSQGINEGFKSQEWERFFEFTGTKLQEFPLPSSLPAGYGFVLDALAIDAAASLPSGYLASLGDDVPSRAGLAAARARWETIRAQMVAWQEELDWHTYALYGLVDESLTYVPQPDPPAHTDPQAQPTPPPIPDLPPVALGQRAFEIVLARRVAAGEESTEWFARHGSTPVTDIPADWPPAYRDLVARRIAAIEANPSIRLLERPEFKRRWAHDSWEQMTTAALRGYILDRLERPELWRDAHGPRVQSVAGLADAVRHDAQVQAGIDVLYGPDADRVRVIAALLADQAVPFLAAYRYKPSGLTKRAEWEAVWALQRREDAGERLDIPVPPKYAQADFRTATYWKHRGKLDVTKERFISYPGAESATDATGVYGWAGWDHADAAAALAGLLIARADGEGWDTDRLVPLLAGLVELEPWLHQWHHHIDPEYGTSPADDITALLDARLATANLTRDDASAWRPAEPRRGRRTGA